MQGNDSLLLFLEARNDRVVEVLISRVELKGEVLYGREKDTRRPYTLYEYHEEGGDKGEVLP